MALSKTDLIERVYIDPQGLQNPLIKEYTLNLMSVLLTI